MNKFKQLKSEMDEFGNSYYQEIFYYSFDPYLFKYIKEFLFSPNNKTVEKYGIISLINKKKYNIINQQKNGLKIIDKKSKEYTINEQIKVQPYLFGIDYPIDKLFVKMREYENVYVCDILDVDVHKVQTLLEKHTQLHYDRPPSSLYKEYDLVTFHKKNNVMGTIYLNKKKYNHQIEITNKEIFIKQINKNKPKISETELETKYGENMRLRFYEGHNKIII